MVLINEWFPNPNGTDTKGEFIELFNNGNAPINLNGWTIKTIAKKVFTFGAQTITAKGYLVIPRTVSKISLKNAGETVSLYNSAGQLVDQSSYLGAAPSGQSFSRVYYPNSDRANAGNDGVGTNTAAIPQSFAWGSPTPGAANKVDLHNGISANTYPFGVPLNGDAGFANANSGGFAFLLTLIVISAILAALVVYSLKSDENLSKLIFSSDN